MKNIDCNKIFFRVFDQCASKSLVQPPNLIPGGELFPNNAEISFGILCNWLQNGSTAVSTKQLIIVIVIVMFCFSYKIHCFEISHKQYMHIKSLWLLFLYFFLEF